MKTLKISITLAFAVSAVVVSALAAEAVLSPRAAANAPRVVADTGHAAPTTPDSTSGHVHGGNTAPKSGKAVGADAKAHCQTAKKGEGRKSCCN